VTGHCLVGDIVDRMLIWLGLTLAHLGLLLAAAGLLLGWAGARGGRLLPGDIVISRPGFTLFLPVATSLVISLLLTLLLSLVLGWRR